MKRRAFIAVLARTAPLALAFADLAHAQDLMRHLDLDSTDMTSAEMTRADVETALADSLYSGYIEKQKLATERVNHHDTLRVPENFQFNSISGLSNEMVERLERARPRNFAQVRQINGLTPAALSTVLVHLTARSPVEAAET
jgi:tRNA uridine 5-carboxymethylaminomethyl modification enzyme